MYPQSVLSQKKEKTITFFSYENYLFTAMKNCSILHGLIFIMQKFRKIMVFLHVRLTSVLQQSLLSMQRASSVGICLSVGS